jgi:hypothetical protein
MNLVQLANDLEYVPRKELAEMSQDPNSSYPAYLVLSEIQRRTLNDKNFAAMQERPTTTVAEEVVGEFMQPQLAENQSQGLQGGTPQSATLLPDSNISAGLSGVPTAPMQMAASGGATGYANKGKTEYKEAADDYGKQLQEIFEKEGRYKKRYSDYEKGERFTYPLTPRDYVVSDEEYSRLKEGDYVMGEGALQEYRPFLMLLNALDGESGARYMPESEVKGLKAKLKASIMEDKLSQMGMASGGRTGYAEGNQTALEESFNNPYENMSAQAQGMTGAGLGMDSLGEGLEDSYNRGKSFLYDRYTEDDGTTDWGRVGKDALAASLFTPYGAIRGAGAKVLSTGAGLLSAAGRQQLKKQLGRFSAKNVPFIGIRNKKTGQFLSQEQIGANTFNKFIRNPLLLGGAFALVTEDDEAIKTPAPAPTPSPSPENIETNSSAGLSQAKDNTGNWRDLARLGAGIMSAKNVGDIGGTVTNILDAQDKRDVQGLQSRYMQIQTEKLEADIAAMPLKELIAAQNSLSDSIKAKNESGSISTPEEIIQINKLYEFYSAEIARRQGFVAETKSAGQDANVIASYG